MIVPLDVLFTVDAGELAIAANIADVDIDMSVGVATLSSMLVKTAYVVLFSALAALAFLVTPFAYFFVEDYSVDEDYLNDTAKSSLGAGRRTCAEKTCSSLKSTSVFILVVLILTLVGLVRTRACGGSDERMSG